MVFKKDDLIDKSVVELVALQPVRCHVVHEPYILRHLVDGCSMLSPLQTQHSWPYVGNKGSNYEHKHGPTLASSLVFIYISYPLHALDKSLSSSINFNDVFNSPYIVGTTYTNIDNITILDERSSPCAGKTPCALGPLEVSSCRFGFCQSRRLDEV